MANLRGRVRSKVGAAEPMVDRLTLDTDLVRGWVDQDSRVQAVEDLLEMSRRGLVKLAFTATIHQDIQRPPLTDQLSILPTFGIARPGGRGFSALDGREMLGSQEYDWVESLV